MRTTGSREWVVPKFNRGLVVMARHDAVEARGIFEALLAVVQADGRRSLQAMAHVFLLEALAILGEWSAWDLHEVQADTLLKATGLVDADVARALGHAGDLASEDRQPHRAVRAWTRARDLWLAMDQQVAAAPFEQRLRERSTR